VNRVSAGCRHRSPRDAYSTQIVQQRYNNNLFHFIKTIRHRTHSWKTVLFFFFKCPTPFDRCMKSILQVSQYIYLELCHLLLVIRLYSTIIITLLFFSSSLKMNVDHTEFG